VVCGLVVGGLGGGGGGGYIYAYILHERVRVW